MNQKYEERQIFQAFIDGPADAHSQQY